MKSNLTVGKSLINADQHLFWKKEVSFIYNDFFFSKKKRLMLHTENCSECQMALQTNHFVHWTFRGFN